MPPASRTVPLAAIRRAIVAAQGFAPRFRRAARADAEAAIRRLGAVQLDSISTVDRAHRLTLVSRIGSYPELQTYRCERCHNVETIEVKRR